MANILNYVFRAIAFFYCIFDGENMIKFTFAESVSSTSSSPSMANNHQTMVQQTNIIWPLAPCQSAFWVPGTASEFSPNWINYQFEGNPLSQSGECLFTLECDTNSRLEINMLELQTFNEFQNSGIPGCVSIYDVKTSGNISLLQKQCNNLSPSDLQPVNLFTDSNLAILGVTLRYGNFQLKARAVPQSFGPPITQSVTTTLPTPQMPSFFSPPMNNNNNLNNKPSPSLAPKNNLNKITVVPISNLTSNKKISSINGNK